MSATISALICVLGIAVGQILFKLTAESLKHSGSYFHPVTMSWFISALIIYAITTIGWISTLQQGTLAKLYPWMALAFILVPFFSTFLFKENLSTSYWIGVATIVAGVSISIRS